MSPGLWLAASWLVRVAAWLAMVYGAALVGLMAFLALRPPSPDTQGDSFVPTVFGLFFFAMGMYAERRARARIRRLDAERRERVPRGFEVFRPADPTHKP